VGGSWWVVRGGSGGSLMVGITTNHQPPATNH
jgi:hypothetical protein